MNNNNRPNDNGDSDGDDAPALSPWLIGAAAVAGITGLAYAWKRSSSNEPPPQPIRHAALPRQVESATSSSESTASFLAGMLDRLQTAGSEPRSANGNVNNLNALLEDIYVKYIKLKEFKRHYDVFDVIFNDFLKKMKTVDRYYNKYSSTVQFCGSHYDRLRIKKPDEFDMDVVIGLPLNIDCDPIAPDQSDITFEAVSPGYVQLKTGIQFDRLPIRDDWDNNNAAYRWRDNANYLLRSNFIEWFEGVVARALNCYTDKRWNKPVMYVDNVPYVIGTSKSGPAITLKISNANENFRMDVDLVPTLKFPEQRWPISKAYRSIPPECKKGYWMVVPKPNKFALHSYEEDRSWRLALHNQERELFHNSYNLRPALRLMKKMRDTLKMDKIASYYIKTLFFWEVVERNDPSFWRNNPAVLFRLMVSKLLQALQKKEIPYFWNRKNNLIGSVSQNTLAEYVIRLRPLINYLDDSSMYKYVAKYLLTPSEFADYNLKYLHII